MSDVTNRFQAQAGLCRLALGAYAWLYAAVVGLVVLDIVYARQLGSLLDPTVTGSFFNQISDFLLFPYGLLMLAGLLALGLAWHDRQRRRLVQASLILPAMALLIALIFGPVLEAAGLGTAIRLSASLGGSLLAMLALMRASGQFAG